MKRTVVRSRASNPLTLLCLFCVGALAGQVSTACQETTRVQAPEFAPHPRQLQLPLITVVAPEAAPVLPLLRTLRSELTPDFDVQVISLRRATTTAELASLLAIQAPRALVLVDNSAGQLYAPIARAAKHPLPSVLVMSSFVERLQQSVPNSTAIGFETPAVTTLSDVRSVLSRPIARAGVVYRKGFEGFVTHERELAQREQIELVALSVPAEPSVANLSRALRHLEHEHIDAVWISNDNVLLSKKLLGNAWVPFAKKTALPIVVGVPALVETAVPFGTYAAVPDTEGLGVQTADLLYALQKQEWLWSSTAVHPPIAVKTYLNVARARELGAPLEGQKRVDVLFEGNL